jgi:hypothetical protein
MRLVFQIGVYGLPSEEIKLKRTCSRKTCSRRKAYGDLSHESDPGLDLRLSAKFQFPMLISGRSLWTTGCPWAPTRFDLSPVANAVQC